MNADQSMSSSSSSVNDVEAPVISEMPVVSGSNRVKIPNQLIVTDRWNSLEVFHYEDGTTDEALLDVRGIVKDREHVVCKSFGYSPEVLASDSEGIEKHIAPLMKSEGVKVFKSYEGTLLRVWQYNGRWFISTHRKLDAFRSKWGHDNASYGELFLRAILPIVKDKKKITSWADEASDEEQPEQSTTSSIEKPNLDKFSGKDAFDRYCASLNPEVVYVFCLTTFSENRVVCKSDASVPSLFCVGTFDRTNEFKFTPNRPETLVASPEEIALLSLDEVVAYTKSIDPLSFQGCIVMTPEGKSAKITNPENDRLMKLRGNVPNVIHRYVQLRWTSSIQEYKELYPEHQAKFDDWERIYKHICHNVLRKYIERHINKRMAILPPEQKPIMEGVHTIYMQQLRHTKQHVTEDTINTFLGTWQERDVNTLVNKYRERERLTGNGNRMPDSMRDGIYQSIRTKRAENKEHQKN